MEILPQEILMDILALLPAQDVGRCRTVSKSWRHLLSASEFIRAHVSQSKHLTDYGLLILRLQSPTFYSGRIDCQFPGEITVLATELTSVEKHRFNIGDSPSCDGLLLIQNDANQFLLTNPTTKEVQKLLVPSHALDSSFERHVSYGLGFDHANDDYKIVCLSYYYDTEDENAIVVHVYSVRNGSWKEVDSSLYELCSVGKGTWKQVESFKYEKYEGDCSAGALVGGSVHWVITDTSNKMSYVMGFDLAEEKLKVIPTPRSVFGDEFTTVIGLREFGGCLCMLNLVSAFKLANIWVMKEYGVKHSWTKLKIADVISECVPLFGVPGRREAVVVKFENPEDERRMVYSLYNLDKATLDKIAIQGVNRCFPEACFRRTLVSPFYSHDTHRV